MPVISVEEPAMHMNKIREELCKQSYLPEHKNKVREQPCVHSTLPCIHDHVFTVPAINQHSSRMIGGL